MGLFDKRRPQQEQETPQVDWQAERARVASFLYRARTFNGTGPEDPTLTVKLKSDERALLVATGTFLVEPRRVPAHWAGEKGGFTFRVPPRAGHLTGQAFDADLAPTDSGDLTFTDKRIVFSGTHKSVEWEYADFLGILHIDHPPWTAVAVSGRDRASGFRYDEGQAEEIRFAIVLGLARFNDDVDSLVSDLQQQLDEIDRAHPPAAPVHASAPAPMPAQPWQGPPGSGAGSGASSPPPASPSSAPSGVPAAAAWPAADPFPAAPATSPTNPVPRPASNYTPDEQPTVTDVVDPVVGVTAGAQGAGETGSGATGEAVVTESQPEAKEDPGVPTGQIPAVTPTPTAIYPAVRPQPATPVQPVQNVQPVHPAAPVQHGAPTTPPGWYPDPWRVARVRWWDGYSWTSYTSH